MVTKTYITSNLCDNCDSSDSSDSSDISDNRDSSDSSDKKLFHQNIFHKKKLSFTIKKNFFTFFF